MTYLLKTVIQPLSKVILCSQVNGGKLDGRRGNSRLPALKLVLERMNVFSLLAFFS